MKKTVRNYLIPHKENNFKPNLFSYGALSVMLAIAIFFFLGSVSLNKFVRTTELGATVYSSVLVDLTNEARKENDRPLLAINEKLTKAAQMKANDMAEKHYFAHTSPVGITPWFWFEQVRYPFVFAGENLAVDFNESKNVEDAWLASPKHRENILDARFREVGIATATGYLEGKQTTFVVQMFGAPALSSDVVPVQEVVKVEPVKTAKSKTTAALKKEVVAIKEEVKGVTSSEPKLSVITETPAAIVVQNETAVTSDVVVAQTAESYASPGATLLVNSPMYFRYGLIILAGFLVFALILFIFVEIKRQHPWRIFLGIVLLVIILILSYVSKSYYLISSIS
jgi:hypothetical protein